jgi:hypothetical protein
VRNAELEALGIFILMFLTLLLFIYLFFDIKDTKDVTVFSSQPSARPGFDELSNGDLDGDKYWNCWAKEIVDNVTTVAPAVTYVFYIFGVRTLFTFFKRAHQTS